MSLHKELKWTWQKSWRKQHHRNIETSHICIVLIQNACQPPHVCVQNGLPCVEMCECTGTDCGNTLQAIEGDSDDEG